MSTPPLPGPNRDPYPQALWQHPELTINNVVVIDEPNGTNITTQLNNAKADNTKIEIAEGSYNISRSALSASGYDDLWIQGQGGVGGVVLDQGTGSTSGPTIECSGTTVNIWENLDIVGQINGSANSRIRARALSSGSELIFKRFRLLDGEQSGNSSGTQGFYLDSNRAGDGHQGTIRFLWCQASGFADNGMYLDGPNEASSSDQPNTGQVIVVGGYYSNNNISSVRIGAGPYSTVYRATIVLDGKPGTNMTENYRGIRMRQPADDPFQTDYDFLIDECDISFEVNSSGGSPINFDHRLSQYCTGRIQDTRIYNAGGRHALNSNAFPHIDKWDFDNIHLNGPDVTTSGAITLTNSPSPNSSDALMPDKTPWWGETQDVGDPGGGGSPGDGDEEDDGGAPAPVFEPTSGWERRYSPEIDRFETERIIEPYTVVHGSSGTWQGDTSITAPGSSRSLRCNPVNNGSQAILATPELSPELHRFPERGEPFEFWFRQETVDQDTQSRLRFFLEPDADDYSGYTFRCFDGFAEIRLYDDGSPSIQLDSDLMLEHEPQTWYRGVVISSATNIRLNIYADETDDNQLATLRAASSLYAGQGYMMWGPSNTSDKTVYWDNIDKVGTNYDRLIENFHHTDIEETYDQTSDAEIDVSIEDWESGNLTSYQGDTAAFDVQGTNVIQGSNALEADDGGDRSFISGGTSTGVNTTPSLGDTFVFYMTANEWNGRPSMFIFDQHLNDWRTDTYQLMLVDNSNKPFRIVRWDDGTGVERDQTLATAINYATLPEWNRFKVETYELDGTHYFYVRCWVGVTDDTVPTDAPTFDMTITDPEAMYTSGNIGFESEGDENQQTYFDYWHIPGTESGAFRLNDTETREAGISMEWTGLGSGGSETLLNGPEVPVAQFLPIKGHYYKESGKDNMKIQFRFMMQEDQ